MEIEKNERWIGDATYKMTIVNEQTGKTIQTLEKIAGVLFIVHQTTDSVEGTRQGAVGDSHAVILCGAKLPGSIRDTLEQTGTLDAVRFVQKKFNLALTI